MQSNIVCLSSYNTEYYCLNFILMARQHKYNAKVFIKDKSAYHSIYVLCNSNLLKYKKLALFTNDWFFEKSSINSWYMISKVDKLNLFLKRNNEIEKNVD